MMFYRRCRHECHAHCRAVCSDRQGRMSPLSVDNKLWWYDSHWQYKYVYMLFPWQTTRPLPIHFHTFFQIVGELQNKGAVLRVLGVHKERMVCWQLPRKAKKRIQADTGSSKMTPALRRYMGPQMDQQVPQVRQIQFHPWQTCTWARWLAHSQAQTRVWKRFGNLEEVLSKARNNVFSDRFHMFFNVTELQCEVLQQCVSLCETLINMV